MMSNNLSFDKRLWLRLGLGRLGFLTTTALVPNKSACSSNLMIKSSAQSRKSLACWDFLKKSLTNYPQKGSILPCGNVYSNPLSKKGSYCSTTSPLLL